MLSFVILVVGFALLVWGADKFVEGASALARKMGASPLLVGLTIVAFGTSMPELAVSVTAALQGANEIAVGNVVGSNIFNVFVILGICPLIRPLVLTKENIRRDIPFGIAASLVLLAVTSDRLRGDPPRPDHRPLGGRGAASSVRCYPHPPDPLCTARPRPARECRRGS